MVTLPFKPSYVQIKSLLFCYLPRKRNDMEGDRGREGGDREIQKLSGQSIDCSEM